MSMCEECFKVNTLFSEYVQWWKRTEVRAAADEEFPLPIASGGRAHVAGLADLSAPSLVCVSLQL